jgi:hypothetical protein
MHMIAFSNRAWLVAALVLSALLLGAAPRSAGAHDHPPSSESSEAAGAGLNAGSVAPGWSQSCPANPGRMCCCAGVFALVGAGKVTPTNAGAWTPAVAPAAGAEKFSASSIAPIAALPRYQARPRAPPLSS